MTTITLKNTATDGQELQATFLPEMGMNLIRFQKGPVEVIDQSTKDQFEERFAGLGALIGPHFYRRKPETLPIIKEEALFPHIARVKAKGILDPFSHGVGRYAPWQILKTTETKVVAELSGKSLWNGVSISDLEGQNFKMSLQAELTPQGLSLDLSVVSDLDSLVGIHYYYHLPQRKGSVISRIKKHMLEKGEKKSLPDNWQLDGQNVVHIDLNTSFDLTLYPFPDVLGSEILLDAVDYKLKTTYASISQENCWQLYHPAGASFVCIEPISSQDPKHPNLSVSGLKIQLEILNEVIDG